MVRPSIAWRLPWDGTPRSTLPTRRTSQHRHPSAARRPPAPCAVGAAGRPAAGPCRGGVGRWSGLDSTAGPGLGVLDGAGYHRTQGSLERGDALVFFTDGVIEEDRTTGGEAGETRRRNLSEQVGDCHESVQETVRLLSRALMLERGGVTTDDAPLLIVEWLGGSVNHPTTLTSSPRQTPVAPQLTVQPELQPVPGRRDGRWLRPRVRVTAG